ncbi:hypothetical protein [Reichenbachiella agariperforans]|uniref:hypothetical protein n=1 Tax=Reichenbachiella agariperforans TaxID=156994 RepID=UPI001C083ED7|nr:hypothetical protein [Reichenbachiella agariperforans]MBU2916220.1 hypothetical protein [Reichenbachiella agariperforans]
MPTKLNKIILAIALLIGVSGTAVQAQDYNVQDFNAGIGVNFAPIFSNYPAVLFSAHALFKDQICIEVGGGPLMGSEMWATMEDRRTGEIEIPIVRFFSDIGDNDVIDHEQGFKAFGEFKYYALTGKHKPFFGTGYSYLQSDYSASYVVSIHEGAGRYYYRNVTEDYRATVMTYYVMLGYRLTFADQKMFFETGVNFNYVDKDITPAFVYTEEDVQTNINTVENIDKYPLPISFDLKLGVLLFTK